MMRIFLLIFIFLIGSNSIIFAQNTKMEIEFDEFISIYTKSKKQIALLDVRTKEEWEEGHIEEAKWLPLQEILQQREKISSQIPFSKKDVIYIICRSGNRSLTATRFLRDIGYNYAVSVKGGMLSWNAKKYPIKKGF